MDVATQTHLTQLRDLLTYRLLELRAELHAAAEGQREPGALATHEVLDRKEEAVQRQLSDIGDTQEQRARRALAEVEQALARLDAGSYGDCIDCAEPIALARLRVQPEAQRCAACQTALEHARAGTR